jgi:pectin methylesterase-like acyl-CoA thioesterase
VHSAASEKSVLTGSAETLFTKNAPKTTVGSINRFILIFLQKCDIEGDAANA